MEQQNFTIHFNSQDGLPREFKFQLRESIGSIYNTVWETELYPTLRITQKDYLEFVVGADIEVLNGDIDETEKEIIAYLFNEQMDIFMKRRVRVDVLVKREQDDIPFEYAEIYTSTFYASHDQFIKKTNGTHLMNNKNGYCRVEYFVDAEFNDRYLRVDELKIGYKIPQGKDRDQRYFKGDVFYLGEENNGIVRAISNGDLSPRVEIKVSFLNDLLVSGVAFEDEVFHGTTTEYI